MPGRGQGARSVDDLGSGAGGAQGPVPRAPVRPLALSAAVRRGPAAAASEARDGHAAAVAQRELARGRGALLRAQRV